MSQNYYAIGGKRRSTGKNPGTMTDMAADDIVDSSFGNSSKFKAVDFPGVNDDIRYGTGGGTDITNNLSVFVWVKPDTLATSMYFAADLGAPPNVRWSIEVDHEESDEFAVVISSDGTVDSGKYKRYGSEGDVLSTGAWQLIGFTFASNVLKLYHNGVEVSVDKHADGTVNSLGGNQSNVILGRTSNDLDGEAMGFSMWSTAVLSDADVLALYNGGVAKNPQGLALTGTLSLSSLYETSLTYPDAPDMVGTNDGTMSAGLEQGDIVDSSFYTTPIKAIEFDGTDETLVIADDASLRFTTEMSYAVWIYANAALGQGAEVGAKWGGDGYKSWKLHSATYLTQTRVLNFKLSDDGTSVNKNWQTKTNVFPSDGWVHIVFTFDNGTPEAYINGVKVAAANWYKTTDDVMTQLYASTYDFKIGGYSGDYMDGKACNVSLWNGVLGQTEATALYNGGVPIDPRNINTGVTLVGAWLWNIKVNYPTIKDNVVRT